MRLCYEKNYYVSYLEGEYPKTLSLLSYDQTHTANAVIDYRSEAMTGITKEMYQAYKDRFAPEYEKASDLIPPSSS